MGNTKALPPCEKHTLHSQLEKLTLQTQEEEGSLSTCPATTQPMRNHQTQPLKSQNSPSQLPPCPYKSKSLFSVLWDLPMACHSLHVLNCNSLLFLNKHILLVKQLAGPFVFLRSTLYKVLPQQHPTRQKNCNKIKREGRCVGGRKERKKEEKVIMTLSFPHP